MEGRQGVLRIDDRLALLKSVALHLVGIAALTVSMRFSEHVIQATPRDLSVVMNATVIHSVSTRAMPLPKPVVESKKTVPSKPVVELKAAQPMVEVKSAAKKQEAQALAVAKAKAVAIQKAAELKAVQEKAAQQKRQEKMVREQLLREEAAHMLESQLRAEQLQAEVEAQMQDYYQQIVGRIQQHWRRNIGLVEGLSCVVRVRLWPTGDIAEVSITRSSGNSAFDASAVLAVKRAAPLPLPLEELAKAELLRGFDFLFKPEEL